MFMRYLGGGVAHKGLETQVSIEESLRLIGAITRGRHDGKKRDGLRIGECRIISASADHEMYIGFTENNSGEPDDNDDEEDDGNDDDGTTHIATNNEVHEIEEVDGDNEDDEISGDEEAELIEEMQDFAYVWDCDSAEEDSQDEDALDKEDQPGQEDEGSDAGDLHDLGAEDGEGGVVEDEFAALGYSRF